MKTTFDLVSEFLMEKFGPDAMECNGKNQISLAVNNRLILIHYFSENEKMLIASCIAPLPQENRENLLLRLLQGQYFFHKTSGMTLSVDTSSTFVVLQTCMDTHAFSTDDFFTIVDNFVHVAEFWEKECANENKTLSPITVNMEEPSIYPSQWMRV
jgi:hypothetical protein